MSRGELHSDKIKIDQKPKFILKAKGERLRSRDDDSVEIQPENRPGDIVRADPSISNKDYAAELAFTQEPVTIRLEPSTEKNAANVFPVWVNGRPADIWNGENWQPVGWLPVGQEIIVKRCVLEVIVRAKIDTIETDVVEHPGQDPENRVKRFTSPVHSFSVIEDKNPRGAAWLREVRRRNY